MAHEKLIGAIDAFAEQSYGSDHDGGELSRQRGLALDAFQGVVIDEAPEGRSEVSDRSVFETVQWIMPSLMRIFAGGDNIVEFDPEGPEDEEVAEQESNVLNYLVTQKNDWDLIARTWMQDGLVTKNAYCMAFIEEKITPEIERYEGQSEEQIALLLEDDPEIVASEQRIDEDNPEQVTGPDGQPVIDPATGQPLMQPRVIYDIEIKRTKTSKHLRFQVLPPERVRVSESTPDFTLEECDYFEYFERETITDLRKMGLDIPDDLTSDDFAETQEDQSRDALLFGDMDVDTPDPSMRQVVVRNIWIRFDEDEDGIAELQHVIRVGDEILSQNPVSTIPVACLVPFINTHRHNGVSVADLVFDIQRIKTSMLRSGIDSLNLATQPRHAVSTQVKLDDLLNSRPGGVVRLKSGSIPGEGHIMPLPTENTFPYAVQGLEHMDRVIESRVGVNRMFQGIDSSNINDHDRVGQLSTMAAQRVEDIARLYGAGFKRLFRIAHELLIKSGHQEQTIKLRGQWVDVNPSQWRTGRDMRITAPFAAGNKDSLLQRLLVVANIHEKVLASGLPIVDVDDAYNLALEIAKAADLPGSKFFTDPATVPPKEPPPDYTALALEIENKKADNQATETQVDAEIDKYKADLDAQVKQYQVEANTQLQLAIANIKAGNSVDLEKVRANLKVNPIEVEGEQLAVSDAFSATKQAQEQMNETLRQTIDAISDLKQIVNAKKRIVRDSDGRISGVETVSDS